MNTLDREHLRKLLRQVDGEMFVESRILMEPRESWAYDEEALLDLMVRVSSRSYAEGIRSHDEADNDELRQFLVERGGKR